MRAIIQDELGGPEVLHPATVVRPGPGIGQVLIRMRGAGVNPADAMNRQAGVFSGPPPFTLGWDVSGVVEATGPGVTLFAPGDEVFGLLPFPRGAGAYAEFVLAPARALVPKPEALSHVQAAALPLTGLTAWQALVETAGVGPGTRVLVTGAAGGVGHLAVQIAAARGAHVIALTSDANAELVRSLGADEVVDYRTTDFGETLGDLDVVLDVVGGDYPLRALKVLRPGGVLVSTLPQSLGPAAAAASELGIRVAGLFVESDRLGLTALAGLVAEGRLTPIIAATYPLDDAATAHATKHGPGKVVLVAG
ncbi:NADP-dependent oxidoreductase [Herbiconiux moechotypicola]|uniref:NADP-dependent oxidoreductase n=2 Tax=Herbiconiux moechotypicola TaxID=637393 RepID=A0ABN3DIF3_9MICO